MPSLASTASRPAAAAARTAAATLALAAPVGFGEGAAPAGAPVAVAIAVAAALQRWAPSPDAAAAQWCADAAWVRERPVAETAGLLRRAIDAVGTRTWAGMVIAAQLAWDLRETHGERPGAPRRGGVGLRVRLGRLAGELARWDGSPALVLAMPAAQRRALTVQVVVAQAATARQAIEVLRGGPVVATTREPAASRVNDIDCSALPSLAAVLGPAVPAPVPRVGRVDPARRPTSAMRGARSDTRQLGLSF